jgi:hypothetical protein
MNDRETIERLKAMVKEAYEEGWHDGRWAGEDWRLHSSSDPSEIEEWMDNEIKNDWKQSSSKSLSERIP